MGDRGFYAEGKTLKREAAHSPPHLVPSLRMSRDNVFTRRMPSYHAQIILRLPF